MYFSDLFEVDDEVLSEYGAFNISLINDLPLFIDPFLLFNSESETYKLLHAEIIKYLVFLRDNVTGRKISNGMLDAWFMFPEVKQAWLGFSLEGNSGRGLGRDFAVALSDSLKDIFDHFGKEQITQGTHLEKLCLIKDGVGKDCISDFVANLIKGYLAEYTQKFAIDNIDAKYCKKCVVDKAVFNYTTRAWEARQYFLPFLQRDYVLLTPMDILRYEDTWINRKDFISHFERIFPSIENAALRFQVNEYFNSFLSHDSKKELTKEEKARAAGLTIIAFPQIIDYYILNKEEHGDEVIAANIDELSAVNAIFVEQVPQLVALLKPTEFYDNAQNTYQDAMARVLYLKQVIENNDGYKVFYYNGNPIKRESDLHVMFRLVCYNDKYDVNSEVNNGRGPVDYKISNGAGDNTLIEFKLASNKSLRRNLQNQVEIYAVANQTKLKIKVILCFSQKEHDSASKLLEEMKLQGKENIILIDARNDNKPSASVATEL